MAALILLCVFLFFVGIGALVGLIRGMNKTVIRLITFIVAMVLTFFASGLITNLVADKLLIQGKTLGELVLGMVQEEQMIADFLESAPLLREAVLTTPAFAIAIVVFPVVFFLLSFISWIVFLCIQRPLRRAMFKEVFPRTRAEKKELKKNKKPFLVRLGKRFAGLGIGAVIGALIFGMIFTPIFGILSILPENSALEELIDTLVDQNVLDADTANMIKTEIAVRDHAILKSYRLIGLAFAGKLYLSSVSEIEYDGQKTNIPAEFESVFSVVQVAIEGGLLKAALDSQNPKAIFAVLSNQEVVDELIGAMFNSRLFCAAIPEVMAMAMESVAITLNVPADKNAVYNNMMDDIATAVKDADINYEGIKAYEAAQIAADYVALDESEAPAIMTKEEYEAEIQKLADLTLKISKIINTAVSSSDETIAEALADQIVQTVKNDIMENGEGILADFNAESVKTTISEVSVSDASAQAVLDQLTDPEKFETDVATVETITQSIRESVQSAVADTEKSQETASTLASVVCNLAGAVDGMLDENGNIVTDENGNVDVGSLDFSKIADAVTELQGSNLKEVGSSMLDIVVSGDLGDNAIVSDALGAIKESYDNGEDLSGTINSAGALIEIGTSLGNGGDITNSFRDLVQNLNETTLNLLSSVLTEETLASMGIAKEYAAIALDTVDALLRELMALQNSANYEEEVNAILSIFDLLSAGNLGKEQTPDLIRQMLNSQVVMNTLDKISEKIISADLLISLGVSEQYAQELCTAVRACISEMLALKNSNASAYNEEVETLVTVFTSLDKLGKEQMPEFMDRILNSQVIMNVLDKVSDDMISAEFLISMGVSDKYAEELSAMLKACIDEMIVLKNSDANAYNAEVETLITVFTSLDKLEKEQIPEFMDQILNSLVIMNVLGEISDEIISDEFLTSMGVSDKYAEELSTMLKACIDEMIALKNNNASAYGEEVEALIKVFTSLDQLGKEQIPEFMDQILNSLVIMNVLGEVSEDIISAEFLTTMGVSEKYAEELSVTIKACVDEMLALKSSDASAYDEEVETLIKVFTSLDQLGKEQIPEFMDQILNSQVIMNVLGEVSEDIISAEFLTTMGVSEKYAEELSVTIKACVDEMLALKSSDASAYDEEVETLIKVFTSLDQLGKEKMPEFVEQVLKSQVIMNVLGEVSEDIISAEFLTSMGVSEKYAEDVCTAAKICIDEMLAIRKSDMTAYNAEVDALVDMFNAIKDKNLNDKEFAKELIDFAKDSDVIYNVITEISESVVLEIAENDRESIANGLEDYYAESGKTERERTIFESIAKIFDVEVTLQ